MNADKDATEIEETEEALNSAEAALFKAAQDIAVAELSFNSVRQDLDAKSELIFIKGSERGRNGNTQTIHLSGMLSTIKFFTDAEEKMSGTLSHLKVVPPANLIRNYPQLLAATFQHH